MLLQQRGDVALSFSDVVLQEVERTKSLRGVGDRAAMRLAGGNESFHHREKERAVSARGLQRLELSEVPISRVPDEVEDEVYDPTAGEDLAVIDGVRSCSVHEGLRKIKHRELR